MKKEDHSNKLILKKTARFLIIADKKIIEIPQQVNLVEIYFGTYFRESYIELNTQIFQFHKNFHSFYIELIKKVLHENMQNIFIF